MLRTTSSPCTVFRSASDHQMTSLTLTSNRRAEEVWYGVQEVDDSQGRREVCCAHHIGGHHGDERHVGAVEVAVEHREGHQQSKGAEQGNEETTQTLHGQGNDVTQLTVPLQPSDGG